MNKHFIVSVNDLLLLTNVAEVIDNDIKNVYRITNHDDIEKYKKQILNIDGLCDAMMQKNYTVENEEWFNQHNLNTQDKNIESETEYKKFVSIKGVGGRNQVINSFYEIGLIKAKPVFDANGKIIAYNNMHLIAVETSDGQYKDIITGTPINIVNYTYNYYSSDIDRYKMYKEQLSNTLDGQVKCELSSLEVARFLKEVQNNPEALKVYASEIEMLKNKTLIKKEIKKIEQAEDNLRKEINDSFVVINNFMKNKKK